jgi:hypothetical protein
MSNVNNEYKIDPKRWESFVLQLLFCVVLACHIPFIFFSGKESLCIMIDELDRKSISQTLDQRIQTMRKSVQTKKMPENNRNSSRSYDKEEEVENHPYSSKKIASEVYQEFLKYNGKNDKIEDSPPERHSSLRNGSHQSNLRYTLQRKSRIQSMLQNTGFGRITFIRET